MNFYQSVFFLKNTFLENIHKKADFGLTTLQYLGLPFLVRAMSPKIFFLNLYYIGHKSVELQRNLNSYANIVIQPVYSFLVSYLYFSESSLFYRPLFQRG